MCIVQVLESNTLISKEVRISHVLALGQTRLTVLAVVALNFSFIITTEVFC